MTIQHGLSKQRSFECALVNYLKRYRYANVKFITYFHHQVLLVQLLTSIRHYLTSHSDEFESIAEQRLTAKKHDLLELFEHKINLSGSSSVQVWAMLV